jgi:uncharacterized protein involved in exopolysaccharide biosynthesis
LKRIAQIYARKGYEKGMEKARKEAASILDEARKRAESMGSRVSSFFAGLMQTWHEPTAEAKAEKEKAKRQVEQERDKRQKAEKAAKEQADKRIVTIANELQVAKARLEASERELLRLEDENHRFKKRISLEMPQKFEKSAI